MSTPDPAALRQEAERLLSRISPGKWIWNPIVRDLSVWNGRYARPILNEPPTRPGEEEWGIAEADAEFIAALTAAVQAREHAERKYRELVFEVVTKHPNESRHETARRYIRERESAKGSPECGVSRASTNE